MAVRKSFSVTAEVDAVLGPPQAHHVQPEVVVLKFRRHGRRLVLPVALLTVAAAATGFWAGSFTEVWVNLAAGAGAAVIALLLGVYPVISWLTHRTTITTNRVVARKGVFVHERTELSWHRVREVKGRRTVLQRMFRSGDIELLHGAERMVLKDVPNGTIIAEALQELMERNFERSTKETPRFF